MRPFVELGRDRLRAYRQRRAEDRAWASVDTVRPVTPPPMGPLPTASLPRHSPPRLPRGRGGPPIQLSRQGAALFGVGAGAVIVLFLGWQVVRVHSNVEGLRSGQAFTPARLAATTVRIGVSRADIGHGRLSLDGKDITPRAHVSGGRLAWKPGHLGPGEHRLSLRVARSLLPDATLRWTFTVDGRPPVILVPPYLKTHKIDEPVEFSGRVQDAEELRANGRPVDVGRDGSFTISLPRPPTGPVELVAKDEAGNRRQADVFVPIPFPRHLHGVHVTATAWDNGRLRQGVIDLINQGLINTVVFTLKDESGLIGHESKVPLAREIGAVQGLYDLRRQVTFLHKKKVHVAGRIVAFRDPKLAGFEWRRGRRDLVIQTPGGGRFGLYGGGFTNFANPVVQQYNIDIATEAARDGVDDILYDYVRRPDGFLKDMVIPGLHRDPQQAIVSFLARSHARLRALGAYQGASVFGVAATRPEQIAQNILAMAGHNDYIAPMLYPSHWNPGEYGIADPDRQPYDIVSASLRDFQQQVIRTGRPLVPWLQHFSLQSVYGQAQIRAQIRAVKDAGLDSWLMWDPEVTYDGAALHA